MNTHRSVSRAQARSAGNTFKPVYRHWAFLAAVAVSLLFLVLSATSARAQFPRIGLSAAPDHHVDNLDVVLGEEFTLYVCVFGIDNETDLEQDFATISWVLHQVCCGATFYVHDVQYSPDFQHSGEPPLGVISSSEVCVDEPFITLATITMSMDAPTDGEYLTACGPYQQAVDCEGGNPLVMGLPMVLNLTGAGSTPTEPSQWSSVKAYYR